MSSLPYFSVVIPTHNRKVKLRITLLSILSQDFQDFEIIVVDDGGIDKTKEMIEQLNDSRVLYFKKENSGPLKTRAAGADKAVGTWIAFCDSDDVWHADYLKNLKYIAEQGFYDCVFSEYQVDGEEYPRIMKLEAEGFFKGLIKNESGSFYTLYSEKFFKRLLEIQPIMISAYAIKKDFYQKIGGIDKSISIIGSEDSDLTLRASALGLTAFNKKCSVIIGRGEDNVSSDYIRNLEGGTDILIKILDNENLPLRLSKDIRLAVDRQLLEIAEQYYWKRNLKLAFSNLRKTRLSSGRLIRKVSLLVKIGVRSSKLTRKI